MSSIDGIDDLVHKEMLAWVNYPPFRKNCYPTPCYLVGENDFEPIPSSLFPDNGAIMVSIAGGQSAEELSGQLGELVVLRINSETLAENSYYAPDDNKSLYYSVFNPSFASGKSDIELQKMSRHSLSSRLMQVIEVVGDVSLYEPVNQTVRLADSVFSPQCQMVFVKKGEYYFGPFEYRQNENDITLNASSSFDLRIMKISATDVKKQYPFEAETDFLKKKASFFEANEIRQLYEGMEPEDLLDWVSDDALLDAAGRVVAKASDIGRNQIRSIKSALRSCVETSDIIRLDEPRKARLEEILGDFEYWESLPDVVKENSLDALTNQQLEAMLQDEEVLKRLSARIADNDAVREKVSVERRKLESSLDDIRSKIAGAQKELESTSSKISQANKEYAAFQEKAVSERRSDVEELENKSMLLEAEIEDKQRQLEDVKKRNNQAVIEQHDLEGKWDSIFQEINDKISLSGKILESEVLHKVVASVSASSLGVGEESKPVLCTSFYPDEAELADKDVVDYLYSDITEKFGRPCSFNDVVNYLTCITQGYITTFAGYPGTGKTSLCNIIAACLGLKDGQLAVPRFNELSVEKGWTSYKDYIGYFNPLTKTDEKSNVSVYNAVKYLTSEHELEGKKPPFLFLLDEANLSPIEHYWAPFLRACDGFSKQGVTFSLGGDKEYTLPNYVRFLATVNFDHTTEALSPRFLDRSWVITLEPKTIDADDEDVNVYEKDTSIFDHAYSMEKLNAVFGPHDYSNVDEDMKKLYQRLLAICNEQSVPVSPRSQCMMKNYMSATSSLMSRVSKDEQYAPLDFAFSQKVLPMLIGPEDRLGRLLEKLSEACAALPQTKEHLDRMMAVGENNGFYQFFV